tara:strand:+ start:533 stop:727 length:195 start_codon:yes stop_codon:yes gene_type:complete
MIFDVMQPKQGKEGKTYWHKVGIAFEKNGRISSVKLESLPLPNEKGEVFVQIFEQSSKKEDPFD